MEQSDLRIEARHADLAGLKEALYREVPDVDLQEETELKAGEHGEALLTGVIVALGGATLTSEVFKTVRHWLDKRVEEKKLETIRFYLQTADGSRDVTLEELMKLVK